jgi:hypothetical protein
MRENLKITDQKLANQILILSHMIGVVENPIPPRVAPR